MNKELCFIIEGKELYLEKVLVSFQEVPIFFLCKNNKDYYIALCVDVDKLNYVVTRLSIKDVFDLLHGIIPMRNAITQQEAYWYIESQEDIKSDTVEKRQMYTLDITILPQVNAYFEILTPDMEKYVQQFDDLFSSEKYTLIEDSAVIVEKISYRSIVEEILQKYYSAINLNNSAETTIYDTDDSGNSKYISVELSDNTIIAA
ncbi:MAG: hypothetical protein J6B69_04930 [Lachnospiraceae bacterium]|nr:hypothetical protein [Lachnospiraceae bacterium]